MSAYRIGQALTEVMAHSTAPMVLSDPHQPDCPMVAMSEAFVTLTGYTRAEMMGRNCRFLQGPDTDPVAVARIRACLAAGQGCVEWLVNYRRDGRRFWNLLFLSPVHDDEGRLAFFFGNQLDITEGFPHWLETVTLGRAHVRPSLEREFHGLLETFRDPANLPEVNATSLDRMLSASDRLSAISMSLTPGSG